MYKFNYTLTEKDYFAFVKFHNKNALSAKRVALLLRVAAIIILAATVFSIVMEGQFGGFFHIFGVTYSVIILFGWVPLRNIGIKAQLKAMKKDGKAPFGEDAQVYFGDDDVHSISESSETRAKYIGLEKVCEDGGAVYIYMNAIQAFVLPHRAFESDAQRVEFLTFIHGKVSSK